MDPQDHVSQLAAKLTKPWYASKKLWLTAAAFGVALYIALTGKHTDLTPAEVVDKIVTIASVVGPIVVLVIKIAHIDQTTAEGILGVLATAQDLNKPDAPVQGGSSLAPIGGVPSAVPK